MTIQIAKASWVHFSPTADGWQPSSVRACARCILAPGSARSGGEFAAHHDTLADLRPRDKQLHAHLVVLASFLWPAW